MADVEKFLEDQALDYIKASGSSKELIVNPCPFCGNDKSKFYINRESGLWDCKVCGEKGNFFKFKKAYGVVEGLSSSQDLIGKEFKPLDINEMHSMKAAFWQNGNAQDYMFGRGFTKETLEHFNIGYKSDHEGEWIAIPHVQDGKLWNVKYRRFSGGDKTFRRVNGQPTILFNIDNISYEKKSLAIVESETDAMAAWQMGVTNVVGVTAGAGSYSPLWNRVMSEFSTIYVTLNSDEAGQKGARSMAEKIGLKKCKRVVLPENDVNDILASISYTETDFKNLFGSHAEKFEVKDVSSGADIANMIDEWYSGTTNEMQGLSTGFPQLDNILKGLKSQDLIVLTGDSGTGKTTFVNNIVNHQIQLDRPSFGFYLEGQLPYYYTRMIGGELGLPYEALNKDPELLAEVKKQMSDLPFYFYSGPQGGLSIEQMREFIPAIVALYDIEILVLDNLQRLVRGSDSQKNAREAEAVSVLKDLCVDLKIPIILIAHTRKRDANQKVLTMQDMKGSSTIYQDADIVLILQIVKQQYYLSVEKNRMGEDGMNIPMEFQKDIGVFKEKGGVVDTDSLGRAPRQREE